MQREIQEIEDRVERAFDKADIRYCGEKYFFNSHINKVKQIALELAKNQEADRRVVLLSSILHDIGYIHTPNNHTDPIHARKIMEEFNINNNVVEKVCYCISNHEKCNDGVLEARILQLADKVSHLDIKFLKMMKKVKRDRFADWLDIKLGRLEECLKKNIEKL